MKQSLKIPRILDRLRLKIMNKHMEKDEKKENESFVPKSPTPIDNWKKQKKPNSYTNRILLVIFIVLLVVVVLGRKANFSNWGKILPNKANYVEQNIGSNSSNSAPLSVPDNVQSEEDQIVNVVEKSAPAVVSIIITKDVPKVENYFFNPFDSNSPFGDNNDDFQSPFDQFFSQPQQQPGQPDKNTKKMEVGGGTGFVVTSNGLIVTNKHVVDDQTADYTVLTNDGREYDARIIGRDRSNDIAVLSINPEKPKKGDSQSSMPTLPLGDSSQVKIGQTAIAIGNALGEFRNTVSKGIISGLSRNIYAGGPSRGEQLSQLIQTDASINPGNSGGPLLNLKGEVVGINVAIAQGAQNIGFAIPINTVKNIIQGVEKSGRIIQPYLGVRYQPIDKSIQKNNNLPYNYGALVIRGKNVTDLAVIPGSPADKAGIQENDIILEVNGTKIDDKNLLSSLVSQYEVGKQIQLKIWHKGEEKTVAVTLEEAPNGV